MAQSTLSPELGFLSHTLLLGCAADGGCSGFFSGERGGRYSVARTGADANRWRREEGRRCALFALAVCDDVAVVAAEMEEEAGIGMRRGGVTNRCRYVLCEKMDAADGGGARRRWWRRRCCANGGRWWWRAERLDAKVVAAAGFAPAFSGVEVVAGEVGGSGYRGRWKERRKLGLGFWEMKMMTWQPSIGQLVSARIVATWLALVG
ncbi:hypothetical protein DEO72_LG6g686 [Vigna unguiculata]|uniref:Uncharacterized protein n=1 Tax=Vigna unguiculata TaxID=3917 RepID=A0A4D6M494_VIGUN|nr:hypothetical protein DEO72_LG6g686 [Vigna unguiculata]